MMSGGRHQNKFAWKPKLGVKINETEVGGRFRPVSEITGVCQRCKEQIEWKRLRQSHQKLCAACCKEQRVCAKCCCRVEQIVGKDLAEVESEQKKLQEAIKNARERYRRSLLRAMNAGNSTGVAKAASEKGDKAGDLFPSASLEEYAGASRDDEDDDIDDGEGILSPLAQPGLADWLDWASPLALSDFVGPTSPLA
ncbi:uncharacterized protein [Pyrus communis]|uniref:uncharacterized protein n=1 Tax=Pyrus communis TaxID=23211 RepID=UPI0035C1E69F